MNTLFSLVGKVVLVTGATGGLGTAIVDAMAQSRACVLVSDLDQIACESTVRRLTAEGYQAHSLPCDISCEVEVKKLISTSESLYGQVDILVCNAGIQGPAGPLDAINSKDYDLVMGTNLKSALLLSSRLIPGMAKRGDGAVIFMSSIAGLRGNKTIGLYGLSKAGLAQLARNLAVEWGPKGVRVNAISPGLIRTPLATELMNNADFMQRRLSLTPLRRVGEPEEVAGVCVMLASRAGGFITGQNLVIDGGTVISDGS